MAEKESPVRSSIINRINRELGAFTEDAGITEKLNKLNFILKSQLRFGEENDLNLCTIILENCDAVVKLLEQLVDRSTNTMPLKNYKVFIGTPLFLLIELFCNQKNLSLEDDVETLDDDLSDLWDALDYCVGANESSTALKLWILSLGKYPVPTKKEKQTMYARYIEGEVDINYIIGSLSRLIFFNAYSRTNNPQEILDLIQEGYIAILEALADYDPKYNTTFSTYANYKIRSRIMRYNCNDETIRVPLYLQPKVRQIRDFLDANITSFSVEEIAKHFGWSIKITRLAYDASQLEIFSYDQILHDSDDDVGCLNRGIYQFVKRADNVSHTDEAILGSTLCELLASANLTEFELSVIKYRMGFLTDNKKPLTLEQTGKILGISRERVRQLEIKALYKLRHCKYLRSMIDFSANPIRALRFIELEEIIGDELLPSLNLDSLFPEYSSAEIADVFNNIPEDLLNEFKGRLHNLSDLSTKKYVTNFLMTYIYDKLVLKYGVRDLGRKLEEVDKARSIPIDKSPQQKIQTPSKIDIRPGIYGFFMNYSKDEIDTALRYISIEAYAALQFKYGENLMEQVSNFANKYPPKIVSKVNNTLSKIRRFLCDRSRGKKLFSGVYNYFEVVPVDVIDEVLESITDEEFKLLQKRFGSCLKKPYPEIEFLLLSEEELKKLSAIKSKLTKQIKLIIREKVAFSKSVSIYDYFNKFGFLEEEIESVLSGLSAGDISFLATYYGKHFKMPIGDLAANIRIMSEPDLLRFVSIIEKIKIELEANRVHSKIETDNDGHIILTLEQHKFLEKYLKLMPVDCSKDSVLNGILRDRMVVFLYLGIGDTPSFSISFIADLFGLTTDVVRKIIIENLKDYRSVIISQNHEVATLLEQIEQINDSLLGRTSPIIGPDIRLALEK